MGGTPRGKDKPGPSYEEGRLRDPEIAGEQGDFQKDDLDALLRKAVQVARKPSSG
jgi:hypothetical protein